MSNKTMEEVWKDISLSFLHSQNSRINHDHHHHHPDTTTKLSAAVILHDHHHFTQPPTGFDEFNSSRNSSRQHMSKNSVFPLHQTGISGTGVNVKEKKRCQNDVLIDSTDRLRRRMIKNRASAERSRARKQAYADGLEVVVDNLIKENNKLKQELKQQSLAAVAQQLLKKPNSLHRTSTAPF